MIFLLIILLLPTIATRLMNRAGGIAERQHEPEEYYILSGQEKIPLEEYLTGALACYMPVSGEDEAYKAMAVLLRSHIRRLAGDGVEIAEEQLTISRLGIEDMRVRLGTDFSYLYGRYQAAVRATKGEVLRYDGEIIEPCFHEVSAGATSGLMEAPYLESVDSSWDIQAVNYLSLLTLRTEEFRAGLQEAAGEEQKPPSEPEDAQMLLAQLTMEPEAGPYRQSVWWKEKEIPASEIQRVFGLSSPAFTFEAYEGSVRIVTRGIGDGTGMSLYGAERMAEEGKSYQEILKHYYSNITVSGE